MKYLEGGSTWAAEQGASDLISSGVDDDDDAEGRATTGEGASERSDEPWDLRLLLGASERAIRSQAATALKRTRCFVFRFGLDFSDFFFFWYFSDFWNTALKWNTLVFSDLDLLDWGVALCFFFFLGESVGLLRWACRGLCYIFFFFNLRVFLFLWLRVFLIQRK